MEQIALERKAFLAELNETCQYTANILHGDEVTKVRIKQYKKYFNRTYKMLHRVALIQGDITNNSFKYGYGGKYLVRKVMIEIGILKKLKTSSKKSTYELLISSEEITLELVSRIIVEVYLIRNDVEPI